jgi:hypothetical protein
MIKESENAKLQQELEEMKRSAAQKEKILTDQLEQLQAGHKRIVRIALLTAQLGE